MKNHKIQLDILEALVLPEITINYKEGCLIKLKVSHEMVQIWFQPAVVVVARADGWSLEALLATASIFSYHNTVLVSSKLFNKILSIM